MDTLRDKQVLELLWAKGGLLGSCGDAGSDLWRGRRVLLTGHTGFKGSWLLLWLQNLGAQVWGYALESESEPNLFAQLNGENHTEASCVIATNLADLEALKDWVLKAQPDVVLHLAAQPLVRRSYADPLGTWATNVQGSLHLLEALKALQHSCAVVMVTTDKVYENREWSYGYPTPSAATIHTVLARLRLK